MQQNSWPKSDELFRGERDIHGFSIFHLRLSVGIGGHYFGIEVPVTKALYDTYKDMGDPVFSDYIKYLAVDALADKATVTHAIPDGIEYGH